MVALAGASLAASADEPPSLFKKSLDEEKSYAIPAMEIVGFDTILNCIDNRYFGCCDYRVSMRTVRDHLHSSWVVDRDPFAVNQLGHPYQGSMYHTFARSVGETVASILDAEYTGGT